MPSRRLVLAGLGCAAGLQVCPRASAASRKLTREAAHYQSTPKGIQSCSICALFVAPDRCKSVTGKISAQGWCSLFDMVD